MSKYELSLAPDYVPEWGVVEAVRELFQNAIDQQTTLPDNAMFSNYDAEKQLLSVGNKNSVLEVKTLLLGSTTKANDSKTIGQHGEGYKVATLVLTRLGKVVTFYNYGAREVWRPRFVKSRRYGTQVLTFFVDKKYIWQSVPDNNLSIEIEGITPEEYAKIVESNLHLQDVGDVIETPRGRILEDEKFKGKVFVNGLFVCKYEPYQYGYDFKPEYIKLDRDRKLVSDFDLQWLSSTMWAQSGAPEKVIQLAKEGRADVHYVGSQYFYLSDSSRANLYDAAYDTFIREYGANAVPVSSQSELEIISPNYKPIIVPESYKHLIQKSSNYKLPEYIDTEPLDKQFMAWFSKIRYWCSSDEVEEFEKLVDKLGKRLRGEY